VSIQRRWIEGKTIAIVEIERVPAQDSHPPYQSFGRIVFTDGSVLVMQAVETENDADVEAVYYPPTPPERSRCPDCDAVGETAGHMECQYPQDHRDDVTGEAMGNHGG